MTRLRTRGPQHRWRYAKGAGEPTVVRLVAEGLRRHQRHQATGVRLAALLDPEP